MITWSHGGDIIMVINIVIIMVIIMFIIMVTYLS